MGSSIACVCVFVLPQSPSLCFLHCSFRMKDLIVILKDHNSYLMCGIRTHSQTSSFLHKFHNFFLVFLESLLYDSIFHLQSIKHLLLSIMLSIFPRNCCYFLQTFFESLLHQYFLQYLYGIRLSTIYSWLCQVLLTLSFSHDLSYYIYCSL